MLDKLNAAARLQVMPHPNVYTADTAVVRKYSYQEENSNVGGGRVGVWVCVWSGGIHDWGEGERHGSWPAP